MQHAPEFGLNRFDWSSVQAFAADVRRLEELGYGYALSPWNPLMRRDPYIQFAAAAAAAALTSRIRMGLLIDNPVLHHPAVSASSVATLDEISNGYALMVYGIGDTAVRFLGLRPAKVAELEAATVLARRLLAGEAVDVGAVRPARLMHARPVEVWIAAGGPRTLEMAGRVADGVFLRVGRHPENLRTAIDRVRRGAVAAGKLVGFLDDAAADSFSLFGSAADIAGQIRDAITIAGRVDIVVPHPVPTPVPGEAIPRQLPSALVGADFKTWFASEVIPRL